MSEDSRDAIKSRIIRNASLAWGYGETQDIGSFDPVVAMLCGALAEEIYNLSGEIKKTDARIIGKMLELMMSPEMYSNQPAHAIAFAKPIQPQAIIPETYQFSCLKKMAEKVNESPASNNTICFTPASAYKLFRGEIIIFGCGDMFFEYRDKDKKNLPLNINRADADFSRLYLGLNLDRNIDKLDGLSLLFSIRSRQYEELLYSILSGAQWKINNKTIEFGQGIDNIKGGGNNLEDIFRKESDISFTACNFVNAFYGSRFMSVRDNDYHLRDFLNQDALPLIMRMAPAETVKRLPSGLVWIEARLPQPLNQEIINELSVFMNCFPVISRQLNEFSQLLTQGVNIIPLKTQDQFFDVRSVSDSKGTIYRPVDSFRNGNANENSFLLRQGGIARFDSRDASETLNHLIDLIRDERAGFSMLGADMVSSELKQLDQIISRMKQRLESNQTDTEPGTYLLLNSNSGFERATIRFWSTGGENANNIKPGTKLTLHQGPELDPNIIFLVTGSSGGRQRLSTEEKINKLRRMLLSRGRIVTFEDIKALCFDHFGNDLEDVIIKKGIHIDPSPERGFIRSLDVHLRLNSRCDVSGSALDQMVDELKTKLMQESSNLMPYRIFIDNGN